MDYYKIIKDGEVVGVGTRFLKWFLRSKGYYYCNFDSAECVQDDVGDALYHVSWMHESPSAAYIVPVAEIEEIDYTEYDELYNQLDDGEAIPIPEPEPEPEPTPEPEPDEGEDKETPMTIAEMREKISEQEGMISMLTDCILEMSEILYGGDTQ